MLIRLVIRAPFLAVGAVVMAMRHRFKKLSVIFLVATPLVRWCFFCYEPVGPLYKGNSEKDSTRGFPAFPRKSGWYQGHPRLFKQKSEEALQ